MADVYILYSEKLKKYFKKANGIVSITLYDKLNKRG